MTREDGEVRVNDLNQLQSAASYGYCQLSIPHHGSLRLRLEVGLQCLISGADSHTEHSRLRV